MHHDTARGAESWVLDGRGVGRGMPELEWSLLCEYCLIDATGRLSIMGIFEQMLTPRVPAQQPTPLNLKGSENE